MASLSSFSNSFIPRVDPPSFLQRPKLRLRAPPYLPIQEPARTWTQPYQPPAETQNLDQVFNDIINQKEVDIPAPKSRKIIIKFKKTYQTSTIVSTQPTNLPTIHARAVETLRLSPVSQVQNPVTATVTPPAIEPAGPTNTTESVDSVSKKALKEAEGSAPPPLPAYVTVLKDLYKGALAALPLLLLALYSSKEELLQNVNVNIQASVTPKVYQIGLGTENDTEFSLAFEVESGKPIRFLHNRDAEMSTATPEPIFLPKNNLAVSLLGPLKHLIWKREEPYTNCNIVIEDKGNPALKEAPLTTYIKASEREGFYLVHVDPKVTSNIASASDFVIKADGSQWASFKALNVTVSDPLTPNEEHRRQVIPLPFTETVRQYLSITQYM